MLLKPKEAADQVYETIRAKVEELKTHGIQPHMATILVDGPGYEAAVYR
jgi:methylenetetrahydrofolate dehydrogenase (NADP+)/methenyltetrahydrofolate cyclohydrolase